jgi:hypothetical protein
MHHRPVINVDDLLQNQSSFSQQQQSQHIAILLLDDVWRIT